MDRGNGLEVIGWANTVAGQVVWSVHRIAQPWADVALIALRFTLSQVHIITGHPGRRGGLTGIPSLMYVHEGNLQENQSDMQCDW